MKQQRMRQITSGYFALSFLFLSLGIGAKTSSKTVTRAAPVLPDLVDKDLSADLTRSKVDCCILKTVNNIEALLACGRATPIFQRDLPYVITQPGVYCIAEDLAFNPPASQFAPPDPRAVQAAITIQSSNVILVNKNHRLYQPGAGTSTQTPYVIGILVPDMAPTADINFKALESIYITGDQGIIDGFSMFGIRIFAHTYDIQLSNLTIKNCGHLAALGTRPANSNYFPHPAVLAANFGPPFNVGGLVIGETSIFGMGSTFFTETPGPDNRVNSLIIENVSCLNNFFRGIECDNATDVTINNSHFDDTWSNDAGVGTGPVSAQYAALSPWGGNFGGNPFDNEDPVIRNMVVSNSTFNNTFMRGDLTQSIVIAPLGPLAVVALVSSAGVLTARSQNVNWNNCQFNGTTCTFFGGFNVGMLSTGDEDSTFLNCSFDNITALSNVNGFNRIENGTPGKSSRNTYLINCTARNIVQIGNQQLPAPVLQNGLQAIGYRIRNAKNMVFLNCIAQDMIVNGPCTGAVQTAAGFGIDDQAAAPPLELTTANIVFEGCVSQRCRTFNGGGALGFSFIAFGATGEMDAYVIKDCISEGHETLAPTLTTPGIVRSVACGYYVQQNPNLLTSIPMSFINCQAMHNKGLVSAPLVGPANGTVYSAGFLIQRALRVSLYECEALDNIYGILLQQCDRCAVRNCRADNNLEIASGTGEGFTDIGPAGTPAAPGVSTSTFEYNHAFMNGNGTTQDGTNGNYNIIYAPAVPGPLVREAALLVDLSAGTAAVNGFFGPTYFAHLHNISTIV